MPINVSLLLMTAAYKYPRKPNPFAHLHKAGLLWSEKVNILPLERGVWSFSPNRGWWISCYIPGNKTIFGGSSLGLLGNLISVIQFPVTWLELRTPQTSPPAKDGPWEKPNMTTIFGWGRGFLERRMCLEKGGGVASPGHGLSRAVDRWEGWSYPVENFRKEGNKDNWQVTRMQVIIRHVMYFVLYIKLEIYFLQYKCLLSRFINLTHPSKIKLLICFKKRKNTVHKLLNGSVYEIFIFLNICCSF